MQRGVVGEVVVAGGGVVAAFAEHPEGVVDEGVIEALVAESGAQPAVVGAVGLAKSVGVAQPEAEQVGVERVVVFLEGR